MSYKQDNSISKAILPIVKSISAKILTGDIKNIMAIPKPMVISSHYTI